jgi:NADPH:quinone reductase-like Zn-dependent oxidoreductase
MRVAEVTEFGGPEVLRPGERPDPEPAAGEVIVAIRAATINPTDLGTRAGQVRAYLADLLPPFVLGWDLAGEVSAVGDGVSGFAPGDRVAGMIPFGRIGGRVGAYAEAAAVDPNWLAPLAGHVGFEEGSTLPLNVLTARQGLDLLRLEGPSRLLVTGASGGVGSFVVQLAVRDGHEVVAVAGRDDEGWVESLGAAQVLPRDADLSSLDPFDAVYDAVPIGPAAVTPSLRDGGAAVFTRPPDPPTADREIRLELVLVDSDPAMLRAHAQLLADGALRTRVAHVLPLEQAAEGHRLAEAGGSHGKIVLRP